MRDDYLWDRSGTADPGVARLEALLGSARPAPAPVQHIMLRARARKRRQRLARFGVSSLAAAAALALLLQGSTRWSVTRTRGRVTQTQHATRHTVATGTGGTATVRLGSLGIGELEENSVVEYARDDRSRLRLLRGTIHLRVNANPRAFRVVTRAADAVDLGCVYSVRMADDGRLALVVAEGTVEILSRHGLVRVPQGFGVVTDSAGVPGLVLPLDARGEVRALVREIETLGSTSVRVAKLLGLVRGKDEIALWSLLPRLHGKDRESVVDRLLAGRTRDAEGSKARLLEGDVRAIELLGAQLERQWVGPPSSWWRRTLVRRGILLKPAVPLGIVRGALDAFAHP